MIRAVPLRGQGGPTMMTAGSFPGEVPLEFALIAGTVDRWRDVNQVVLCCFRMLFAAVRPAANVEGLTIAFDDLPGNLQGVDFAKEPPLRRPEPASVHRRHPLQPAFKVSEVISGDPPNGEPMSCLASQRASASKPIGAEIFLSESFLLHRMMDHS